MPTASNDEIKILSNGVQEIISYRPVWILRNGITLFVIIISCLIGATFFISYPDVVHAGAMLTSINAPKEVKTKTEGKLIKLYAAEGRYVKQNELLGFMESRANHLEVMSLSKTIDEMQALMNSGEASIITRYLLQPYQNLGEAQQPYQTFTQSFILFKQYLQNGYYLQKKTMLQNDMTYLQRLHANLLQQKEMQVEDLGLAKETFDANHSLKEDKIISPLDYRNEKSKYIGKSLTIPQISSAIISNESGQHEKEKEILQLENDIAQQKGIFTQALNTLKAQLDEWKTKYLLIAPIDGKVAFTGFMQDNQQLKNNQTVCFINPENTAYFVQVNIPQYNFGKIKQGQKVLLKLSAYPYQEFGAITGKLDFISNIPTDSGYIAKVLLPNGLETNYKRLVLYREGLSAEAEIITADLKLSDRVLNQLRSVIKNE
jgi:multidrug efflux pump subunit AcrA (membrane-fusion protein)